MLHDMGGSTKTETEEDCGVGPSLVVSGATLRQSQGGPFPRSQGLKQPSEKCGLWTSVSPHIVSHWFLISYTESNFLSVEYLELKTCIWYGFFKFHFSSDFFLLDFLKNWSVLD